MKSLKNKITKNTKNSESDFEKTRRRKK